MKEFNPKKRLESHPPNRRVVDQIKKEIIKYIEGKHGYVDTFFNLFKKGYPYNEWYVGITYDTDVREKGHRSSKNLEELKYFKYWQAHSFSNARTIEMELCNEFTLDSCQLIGNAKEKTKYVYVFNRKQSKIKSKDL